MLKRKKPHDPETYYDHQAQRRSTQPRAQSDILWVRNFNNWVKMVLIRETATCLMKRPDVCDLIVHDWACGRGGDVTKWQHEKVAHYTGVDLSAESVKEAKRRVSLRKESLPFRTQFYCMDLRRRLRWPVGGQTHIISMQFALHYMVRELECVLESVAWLLRRGGRMVGTVSNGNHILEQVSRISSESYLPDRRYHRVEALPPPQKGFGNQIYQCEYKHEPTQDGDPYLFTLKEAVDHVEEYVLTRTCLEAAAQKQGLVLKEWKPLDRFYYERATEHMEWYQRFVGARVTPDDGWQLIKFYSVFVLEKP